MNGEITELIAILGVGIALATFMFAIFRILDRRIDETNQRIDESNRRFDDVNRRFDDVNLRFDDVNLRFDETNRNAARIAEDVAELKGSLTIIRDAIRLRVSEPTE